MSPEQLDAHFKNYAGSTKNGSLFSQMNLKHEEFDKLPSITKKKVLINMTGVRQTIASDPNPTLESTRLTTIKSLVNFSKENWHYLNESSKELIAE